MAAPKKTNPKTMDVKSPDTTVPDSSSRPLIVGNRSMIQDPMVRTDESAEPGTSPLLDPQKAAKATKITIKPKDTDSDQPTEDAQAAEESAPNKPVVITPLSDKKTEDPESTPESQSKPTEEVGKPEGADAPETKSALQAKLNSEPEQKETDKPEAKDPSDSDKSAKPKEDDTPKPAPEKPDQEETNPDSDVGSEEDAEKPDQDSEAKQKAEEAEAEAAELERIEHIKTLVNDKTYFVATGRQKGHGGRWAFVLLLLVVVAAASAAYVYLNSSK